MTQRPELEAEVLIVDDEPAIRNGCRRVLSSCGANVEIAANGDEAMQLLSARAFDVAIIDLIMPSFGGMEVLERIAQAEIRVVPIVITAHASIDTAIEAVKRGAFDYLPKPFFPQELVARVQRGVRWLRVQEDAERHLLELNTEKTRLRGIVNSLADGVFVTNREGQVVLSNPAAQDFLGVVPHPGRPRPLEDFVRQPELRALIASAVCGEAEAHCSFVEQLETDESIFMARVVPLCDPEGEAIGTATVLRDISELVGLERAKSHFMARVAHELKSPLAAVQGFLNVLRSGQDVDPERLDAIVERCCARVDGMSQMVRDLLDLSQASSIPIREIEALDLSEVIDEVVEAHAHAALASEITVQAAVPSNCPRLHADRENIVCVLGNLLSNAIKYNRPHGTVTMSVHLGPQCVRIDVRDTGLGIPQEAIPRLGEEFHRIHTADRKGIVGTGLGLALVKRIVESYNGEMEVESTVGQGSTFSVRFPLQS